MILLSWRNETSKSTIRRFLVKRHGSQRVVSRILLEIHYKYQAAACGRDVESVTSSKYVLYKQLPPIPPIGRWENDCHSSRTLTLAVRRIIECFGAHFFQGLCFNLVLIPYLSCLDCSTISAYSHWVIPRGNRRKFFPKISSPPAAFLAGSHCSTVSI